MEHVMADIVKTRIFVCCSEDNGYKLWAIACRLRKIAIDFRIFSCSQQDLKWLISLMKRILLTDLIFVIHLRLVVCDDSYQSAMWPQTQCDTFGGIIEKSLK